MGDYHIIPLTPNDLYTFKPLRLEMFQQCPQFCNKTLAEVQAETGKQWMSWFIAGWTQVFAIQCPGDWAGMGAIRRIPSKPHTALMELAYVKPAHRGHGLHMQLFLKRAEWALQQGNIDTLFVSYRITNAHTAAMLRKTTLSYSHMTRAGWGDGTTDDMVWYEASLKKIRFARELLRQTS